MSVYEKRVRANRKILLSFLAAGVILFGLLTYLNSFDHGKLRYVLDRDGNIIVSHRSSFEDLELSSDNDTLFYYYNNHWSEDSHFDAQRYGEYSIEAHEDKGFYIDEGEYITSYLGDLFLYSPKDYAIEGLKEFFQHGYFGEGRGSYMMDNGLIVRYDSKIGKYGVSDRWGNWKLKFFRLESL